MSTERLRNDLTAVFEGFENEHVVDDVAVTLGPRIVASDMGGSAVAQFAKMIAPLRLASGRRSRYIIFVLLIFFLYSFSFLGLKMKPIDDSRTMRSFVIVLARFP